MKTRAPAAILALVLCSVAAVGRAQPVPGAAPRGMFDATTLSLSAHGEAKAAPDMATITLGVQTSSPSAAEAMAVNARRMGEVVASLRRSGLEGKDIQTSDVSLQAQYDYQQNRPPRPTGYQASNRVTVTVNDLARLGPALDAAVAAGGNQVNGIDFGLKNPQAAEDQARLEAVKALQAKAGLYAGATGHRLGRLVNLSEGVNMEQRPELGQVTVTAMRRMAAPTPVEAGELTVRVDITGIYELTR